MRVRWLTEERVERLCVRFLSGLNQIIDSRGKDCLSEHSGHQIRLFVVVFPAVVRHQEEKLLSETRKPSIREVTP